MERISKDLQPNPFDALFAVSGMALHASEAALFPKPEKGARHIVSALKDKYDQKIKGYLGEDNLKYEIPLPLATPSEYHARIKSWNIQILLDNVSDIAHNDLLPQTSRERELWDSFIMMKWRLCIVPFTLAFPVTYITCRNIRSRLKTQKGRGFPLMLSLSLVELWYDAYFPAYELLNETLSSRTPLGDAARADWQRLQPLNISYQDRICYFFYRLFGYAYNGHGFGGSVQI